MLPLPWGSLGQGLARVALTPSAHSRFLPDHPLHPQAWGLWGQGQSLCGAGSSPPQAHLGCQMGEFSEAPDGGLSGGWGGCLCREWMYSQAQGPGVIAHQDVPLTGHPQEP